MKTYQARLMVLLSAFLWSAGGPVAKLVTFRPLTLVFLRGITGTTIMFLYIFMFKWRGESSFHVLKTAFSSGKKTRALILGIITYSIAGITVFMALRLTTAANATLFQHTSPIWVAVLGFLFLGEKASFRHIFSIIVVLFGIFLCMTGKFDSSGTLGNILALISGLNFAFLVIAMRLMEERSSLIALALGMFVMVVASIPSFIADINDSALVSWQVILSLSMGLIQFAAPFIMYNRALKWMKAVESTILRILEPLLATLWVALIVGEVPGRNTFIGGGLVIAVLVFLVFDKSRKPLKIYKE